MLGREWSLCVQLHVGGTAHRASSHCVQASLGMTAAYVTNTFVSAWTLASTAWVAAFLVVPCWPYLTAAIRRVANAASAAGSVRPCHCAPRKRA